MIARKEIIGFAWLQKTDSGTFVNAHINKAALDKLPVDQHGNVTITIAEMRKPDLESGATHLIYQDFYRFSKSIYRHNESKVAE